MSSVNGWAGDMSFFKLRNIFKSRKKKSEEVRLFETVKEESAEASDSLQSVVEDVIKALKKEGESTSA